MLFGDKEISEWSSAWEAEATKKTRPLEDTDQGIEKPMNELEVLPIRIIKPFETDQRSAEETDSELGAKIVKGD